MRRFDAEIGHAHFALRQDGHVVAELFLALKRIRQPDALSPVDLQDERVDPRQRFAEQLLRPALERFGHHGVIRIRNAGAHLIPRHVPVHVEIIDENADQFGNGERRMGIVDVNGQLIFKVVQRPILPVVLLDEVLHGSGYKKVAAISAEAPSL